MTSRLQKHRATISPGVGFNVSKSEDLEIQIGSSGDRWVFVEFRSAGLAACHAIEGVFDELARKHREALFLRVDIDQVEGVQDHFRVYMLPTYMCYWGGAKETQYAGCSEGKLRQTVADCLEMGPQVSFCEFGETKDQAMRRLRDEHLERTGKAREREALKQMQRHEEEQQKEYEQQMLMEQMAQQLNDIQNRFADQRWTPEADEKKRLDDERAAADALLKDEEEKRNSERAQKAEEARIARMALEEAQKVIEDMQKQHNVERRQQASAQKENSAALEAQEREIAELKAGLEQARQQAEFNENYSQHLQQKTTESFEGMMRSQAQRAQEEVKRLQEEAARLKAEAEQNKQVQERLQLIFEAEQNMNVKFQSEQRRIHILRPLRFVERVFGAEKKDPPTAEFVDPAEAEAIFSDIMAIANLHPNAILQMVRTERKPEAVASSKQKAKNEWDKALMLSRVELLKRMLVQAGATGASTTTQLKFGEQEAFFVQLQFPAEESEEPPFAVKPHNHK
mmetsp:Transcript_27010/g.58798  ORF Transcript_27010/g.58798 Transcript_27010/m.58798 type:complete len:511 (+) Transcript_27010:126-1658(+)|eukprot:CAMPEP_0206452254 /NCGR_PEP_ID=MMETSP0324_2-20121206/19841_1 /ASSEMBLY_ACC=CAM_ASM_000836 /TAXON_ID=2866 /ORGANISM="Crypthecodinium cohnii, Strain Seligo" /LENGTH=510 /DNA_ID=CAMNT_0053922319 /DNA_START=56 /DNA_END=1588 /DNA_ORIENTATION=-